MVTNEGHTVFGFYHYTGFLIKILTLDKNVCSCI